MPAMGNAYIGAVNYLYSPEERWALAGRPANPDNIEVTSSNNMQAGYPDTNVTDGSTATRAWQVNAGDQWFKFQFRNASLQPIAVQCNGFGFAGSNLHVNADAQWRAAWSDDDTNWNPIGLFRTEFGANGDFYTDLTVGAHPYWRFSLNHNGGTEVYVGAIYLGSALQLWNPPNPGTVAPPFNSRNEILNNVAQGGSLLGTSALRRGGRTSFSLSQVPWTWIEQDFKPTYDRIIEGEPFFYTWDQVGHPEQAAYGVAVQNPSVRYDSHSRAELAITMDTTV